MHELRDRFWRLKPDEPNPVDKTLGPSCRHCGSWTNEPQTVVRCGACEKISYPLLILFWSCSECGGPAGAVQQWAQHLQDEHAMGESSNAPPVRT